MPLWQLSSCYGPFPVPGVCPNAPAACNTGWQAEGLPDAASLQCTGQLLLGDSLQLADQMRMERSCQICANVTS